MIQDDIVARAKSGMAVQKLIPLGEYLDLMESRVLEPHPTRYQELSIEALAIIDKFRTDRGVREACGDSTALSELLENVDYKDGTGALSASRALKQA